MINVNYGGISIAWTSDEYRRLLEAKQMRAERIENGIQNILSSPDNIYEAFVMRVLNRIRRRPGISKTQLNRTFASSCTLTVFKEILTELEEKSLIRSEVIKTTGVGAKKTCYHPMEAPDG